MNANVLDRRKKILESQRLRVFLWDVEELTFRITLTTYTFDIEFIWGNAQWSSPVRHSTSFCNSNENERILLDICHICVGYPPPVILSHGYRILITHHISRDFSVNMVLLYLLLWFVFNTFSFCKKSSN